MCLRLLVVQVYAKLRHVGAHHKNTTLVLRRTEGPRRRMDEENLGGRGNSPSVRPPVAGR